MTIDDQVSLRRFIVYRRNDSSGTSGEGVVAEGVEFSDGKVALKWRTAVSSVVIYDNIKGVVAIHGHGDDTVVDFIDGEEQILAQKNVGVIWDGIPVSNRTTAQKPRMPGPEWMSGPEWFGFIRADNPAWPWDPTEKQDTDEP